jgi:hypothetical protein
MLSKSRTDPSRMLADGLCTLQIKPNLVNEVVNANVKLEKGFTFDEIVQIDFGDELVRFHIFAVLDLIYHVFDLDFAHK